jgi:phosphatidylinositol glycan class Z
MSSNLILYCLYALRIALCLLPQHGYIQPDEFFQFTEPAADRSLQCRTFLPWELTRSQPIRSMFFPVLLAQTLFSLVKYITPNPSGYVLLVLPRLVMTILSFVCDWSLHVIMKTLGRSDRQNFYSKLSLASSYVFLTYMTHTFSNSIETILFSILLVLVTRFVNAPSDKLLDMTGAIVGLGFFNRPTFLGFAVIPIIWMITGGSLKSLTIVRIFQMSIRISVSFSLTAIALICWDTNYYTDIFVDFWNVPGSDYWEKLVICPLNFIIYNSQTSNLARHGLHPRYLHLFNLFLLLNGLALPSYCFCFSAIASLLKPHPSSVGKEVHQNRWLAATVLISVSLLMIFPHQEPRFLIPVTVIACLLVGDRLRRKRYLIPWIIINILFTLMYGFVHQAGVTKSLLTLNHMIRTKEITNQTLIFVQMYLPPQHLMNAPRHLLVHDLSVSDFPESLIDQLEVTSGDLLLVAPSSLDESMRTIAFESGFRDIQLYRQYFPHFSAEVFFHSWNTLMTSGKLRDAFSLNIWKIASR